MGDGSLVGGDAGSRGVAGGGGDVLAGLRDVLAAAGAIERPAVVAAEERARDEGVSVPFFFFVASQKTDHL